MYKKKLKNYLSYFLPYYFSNFRKISYTEFHASIIDKMIRDYYICSLRFILFCLVFA